MRQFVPLPALWRKRPAMFALQETTVVGISAIIGTLLGTLIGAGVTLWVQMTQRKHEDRTRFHEERLKIYAEYT
jgi:hypothetical protein